MRFTALLTAAAMASPAVAQMPVLRPGTVRIGQIVTNVPRVGIGVTTTSAVSSRDTLGLLVTSVRPGSPADKAGIEEGNRISSINGVSLRLAAADVGEYEMANVMSRRLTRELEKLKAGDEVTLQVYAGGQTKTVRAKTVEPSELSEVRRSMDERATLGLNIGLTGSARDSIGVFVMSVIDGGPAAKAGIEEGTRIASINGVDLRTKHEPDDDYVLRTTNVNRLERELGKVKPGDDVDLRLYYAGQFRNVKVKTVRMTDLPRSRNRAITIMGGDNMRMSLPMPPLPPDFGDNIRRAVEGAVTVGRTIPRVMFGNRVVW
jgi:C-terminal processing protease CtpA/Prc